MLCPYDWPEPFSIVLIEALACGTSGVGVSGRINPGDIEDGARGLICDYLQEMVAVRIVSCFVCA